MNNLTLPPEDHVILSLTMLSTMAGLIELLSRNDAFDLKSLDNLLSQVRHNATEIKPTVSQMELVDFAIKAMREAAEKGKNE